MSAPKRSRVSIVRLSGTLIAAALIIWLISRQGWDEIGAAVVQIGWQKFVLAIAIMFISRIMVSLRWHMLMRSADIEIPVSDSLRLTFVGLFASNFLPTTIGGDVVRIAGVIQSGYDVAVGTASSVMDRLVGASSFLPVLPLGLQKLLAATVLLPKISAAAALPTWLDGLFNKAKTFTVKIFKTLAIWLKRPWGLARAYGFSFAHMGLLFLTLTILLDGMGEPLPYFQVAGLWALVYYVTLLPISINGLGVQELSVAFAFSELGGVSEQTGLTLALLIRTLFMLASLPGAFFIRNLLPKIREVEGQV